MKVPASELRPFFQRGIGRFFVRPVCALLLLAVVFLWVYASCKETWQDFKREARFVWNVLRYGVKD